jgi:hypothetical protein
MYFSSGDITTRCKSLAFYKLDYKEFSGTLDCNHCTKQNHSWQGYVKIDDLKAAGNTYNFLPVEIY